MNNFIEEQLQIKVSEASDIYACLTRQERLIL
jgi:hypothetical protein